MSKDEELKGKPEEKILWATFLESTPPNAHTEISGMYSHIDGAWRISMPDIQIFCNSESCGGIRFFKWNSERVSVDTGNERFFAVYICRNCLDTGKLFAILCFREKMKDTDGRAIKLGEIPEFGPPVPSRVITLIGPDRELFLRGRRSENQGLGIGSYAYYRRVVENQWKRLIQEIIKVAEKVGASPGVLAALEKASQETQFSRAVEDIKDAIPQALLIDGHNPITLLHNALSEGLHGQTDEKCLGLATSIRIVLTELAERTSQVLKDEAELKSAVSRLLKPRDEKFKEKKAGT